MIANKLHGKYSNYRFCMVRECKNTSIKTEKLWIKVPSDIKMRNTWLTLAKRDPLTLSTATQMYFCEDHFDLENDMENYMQYKLMGSVKRIKMKPECVPTRFDCQTEIKHKHTVNKLEEEYNIQTITYGKETTWLLQRILQHLQAETEPCGHTLSMAPSEIESRVREHLSAEQKAAVLTGFTEQCLCETPVPDQMPLDRRLVHDAIAKFYECHRPPTTNSLYRAVSSALPSYCNIDQFRKILIKMGYCWKRVKTRWIVVENPKLTFQKYMYLRSIQRYRQEGRPLCFVGSLSIETSSETHKFLYAVLDGNDVDCIEAVPEFGSMAMQRWIQEHLTLNLRKNSVVVLPDLKENYERLCVAPGEDRDAMRFVLDVLLKKDGHEVLRLPSCIKKLCVTSAVECHLKQTLNASEDEDVAKTVLRVLRNKEMLGALCAAADQKVAAEEARLLHLEEQMDKCWDKALSSTDSGHSDDEEYIPPLSDSE